MVDLDTELGEVYYQGEEQLEERYTDEIIDVIRRAIRHRFKNEGHARRDAHAFDTGCVKASFRVDKTLNPELSHGVFVPGKEYPAWIRFSNGNFVRRSPRSPDARGMSIKLMGVPGPKLLDDETYTQDFILISSPAFFVNDLQSYKAVLEEFLKGGWWDQWVSAPLKLNSWRSVRIALRVNRSLITNPLSRQYWSMTPYRLGVNLPLKTAVKYTVKPSGQTLHWYRSVFEYFRPGFSQKLQMSKHLTKTEARFEFYIQRYVDHRTPVEDSTVEWTETVSKPEHVGQIIIPTQDVMSLDRIRFCENLSFNPWNCLAEHKPLGLVNRVRRRIYLDISQFRHTLNETPRIEPKSS